MGSWIRPQLMHLRLLFGMARWVFSRCPNLRPARKRSWRQSLEQPRRAPFQLLVVVTLQPPARNITQWTKSLIAARAVVLRWSFWKARFSLVSLPSPTHSDADDVVLLT